MNPDASIVIGIKRKKTTVLMKLTSNSFAPRKATQTVAKGGFTLIELLVVIAIIAILAAILLPALARAKSRAQRMQCMGQMKQLDLGISLFANDNGDMYPAAGYGSTSFNRSLSWDTWIYPFIGGSASVKPSTAYAGNYAIDPYDAEALGDPVGLPIVTCPADTLPKVAWMHINNDASQPLQFATRTYAMNSAGVAYSVDIQVDPQNGKYPLPDLTQPNRHGVGIYWLGSGLPDAAAKGYQTTVVKDPAGTILLCENPSSQGTMGNQWPCCSCGPYCTIPNWSDLFQIDPGAPTDVGTLTKSANTYSEGTLLYKAHNNRFNYAFHDGHVEALKYTDTIGSGTLLNPAGMWTAKGGD